MENQVQALSNDDSKVINARQAEKSLFNCYGFEAKEHFITLFSYRHS